MAKNRTQKENRKIDGDARNAEWRKMTFAAQKKELEDRGCWIGTVPHLKKNDDGTWTQLENLPTKQARRIEAQAEKFGWDACACDVIDYTPAKKQPKKRREETLVEQLEAKQDGDALDAALDDVAKNGDWNADETVA